GHDRRVSGRSVVAYIGVQRSDSFQQHPAVTDRTNADFLQVLLRQAREDPLVYLVLAECRLVSFEAQAPQPNRDIHDGVPLRLEMLRPRGWPIAATNKKHTPTGTLEPSF